MSDRVRIAMRHKSGSVATLLGWSAPQHTHDFRRENVRQLRAMERQLRQKRIQEEEDAQRVAFKLQQFANVPSRLHLAPRRMRSCQPAAWSPVQELSHSVRHRSASATRGGHSEASSPWAKAPPRGLEAPSTLHSGIRRPSKAPDSPPATTSKTHTHVTEDKDDADMAMFEQALQRGHSYALQKQMPCATMPDRCMGMTHHSEPSVDFNVPPGYRVMEDEERLQTLHDLQSKILSLDQRYAQLPLNIETVGQRRQQQTLRDKIGETEAALKLFSRPCVLVEV